MSAESPPGGDQGSTRITARAARDAESGPRVALLFHRLLALVFVLAWASLGAQVNVLVGSRGLLPARDLARMIAERGDVSFLDAPSLFRFGASDGALSLGVAAGAACSLLALLGFAPRLFSAASTFLYLGYAVICRNFLSFQWDNLLLECGALAALLPPRTRAPWVHFLLRALLFKLYFESGLAKYGSTLGDWKDGSAMRFYYETAPIPTWVAWYAHQLPPWFHRLESWGALGFELGVPFLVFLGQRGRLAASAVFAGFQFLNILTANYGFFSYLALVLQVMLLTDGDVRRAGRAIRERLGRSARGVRRCRAILRLAHAKWTLSQPYQAIARVASGDDARTFVFLGRLSLASVVISLYLGVSLDGGLQAFAGGLPASQTLSRAANVLAPLRLINTYHLFSSITRERVEPTFETFDGETWTEHQMHYKPGDPRRPPPFVAPHQPRVDFLLWFYGLSHERGTPLYVQNLVMKLCSDPGAVA
ncbi:MAG TPA: lipase maturation factor family protein, partial [Polyangiaceae bacterium]